MRTEHRQGDSWSYIGTAVVTDVSGNPVNMAGWTISSDLKTTTGEVISSFSVGWIDVAAQTFYHRHQSTADWPVGKALFNIRLVSPDGDIVSSAPTAVYIVKAF